MKRPMRGFVDPWNTLRVPSQRTPTSNSSSPCRETPDGVVAFEGRKLVYPDARDTHGLLIELVEIRA